MTGLYITLMTLARLYITLMTLTALTRFNITLTALTTLIRLNITLTTLMGLNMTQTAQTACPNGAKQYSVGLSVAQYIGLPPIIPAIMDPMRHRGAYIAGINVGTTWLPEKKRQGNKLYKHTKND